MPVDWFAECFVIGALRPTKPTRCTHYGAYEWCTIARGTEPRLFARGGACEAPK